jgi:hypothetical protein
MNKKNLMNLEEVISNRDSNVFDDNFLIFMRYQIRNHGDEIFRKLIK